MLEDEYAPRRKLPPHLRKPSVQEAPFAFAIRDAEDSDLPYVREIYNYYVRNSTVTFDEKPVTLKSLRSTFGHVKKLGFPYLVAESPSGTILGYAFVYPWREKAAYRYTVELSIYLGAASTGKGLGKALMAELIERSRAAGIRELIAVIADKGADASIAMHKAFGFEEIGRMGRVGFKFDRWLGTVLLQKSIKKR